MLRLNAPQTRMKKAIFTELDGQAFLSELWAILRDDHFESYTQRSKVSLQN